MNANIPLVICLAFLSPAFVAVCPALPPQQMQQPDPQATAAADRIRQNLEQTLRLVGKSENPPAADIAMSGRVLDESKRYIGQLDDSQKAQYILLQGWMSWYHNDLPLAYTAAAKACRLDQEYGDAWASQIAFAILMNKKPMTPRPQRPRQRAGTPGTMEQDMYVPQRSMGQNAILKFDIQQLQTDKIGQKITSLKLKCLNGAVFSWQPGKQPVCLLYWQKFDTPNMPAEPNSPAGSLKTTQMTPQRPPAYEVSPMMEAETGAGYGQQNQLAAQTAACTRIVQSSWLGGGNAVGFVSVNIDAPDYRTEIIDHIFKQPQPWAVALAADQETTDGLPAKPDKAITPMLAIADAGGNVRYAGPADTFIVPMLLNYLITGSATAAKTAQIAPNRAEPNGLPQPDTEPNPPAKSRPAYAAAPRQPAIQQADGTDDSKMPLEEQIEAEKRLEYAKGLFMPAAGKHAITYKRGVDLCRQIMKKYPNTSYAQQASELLKQVPENQRQRYGITDQELGL